MVNITAQKRLLYQLLSSCHLHTRERLRSLTQFTLPKRSHLLTFRGETALRLFLRLLISLPTDAADTTDLSASSVAPQFHLRATGTHIFSKQLTRSEPKWQLPALKWLPCRIDAESQECLAWKWHLYRGRACCVCPCARAKLCASVCFIHKGQCSLSGEVGACSVEWQERVGGGDLRRSEIRQASQNPDSTPLPAHDSHTLACTHAQTHTQTYIWHIHAQPNE